MHLPNPYNRDRLLSGGNPETDRDRTAESTKRPSGATVFVIDSDPRTVQVVRTLVDTMNWRCGSFSTGDEFLRSVEYLHSGCIVLEALAENINGLQVQQMLNRRSILMPVVFVAARSSVSIAVRAMRSGALHFLEKPFGKNELWDAIQEAMTLDQENRAMREIYQHFGSRLESLTEGENAVLNLLTAGEEKRAIADQLGICVRTVELRKKRIMKKVGVDTTIELVRVTMIAKEHPLLTGPHARIFRNRLRISQGRTD